MSSPDTPDALPDDVFSIDEIRVLEEACLFLGPVVDGKRKVSAAVLSPPENGVFGSGNLSASIHYYSCNSGADPPIDLPVNTVSVAALELIGLTKHAAADIFHRFVTRPNPQQNPDTFLDYITSCASRLTTEPLRSMAPDEAMTQIGISVDTRRRILDPKYTQLFWTQTLAFWVKNTLRISYLALEKLEDRLKDYVSQRKHCERTKRSSSNGIDHLGEGLAGSSKGTGSLSTDCEDRIVPKAYTIVSTVPDPLKGHYILWKETTADEIHEYAEWTQPDGSLIIDRSHSRDRGDFNYNPAWYWREDRDTAEYYRLYTVRRCPMSETWLIRIQIPAKLMEECTMASMWYGYDWKQYVWHCKREMAPPEKYKDLWCGKIDIIRGHISTGAGKYIGRIRQSDVQTELTEDNLLRVGDRKCVQVVFMHHESWQKLARSTKDNVHVEIHKAEPGHQR